MDSIRNCYSAWMNTPDAGRIRVRWYRLPNLPPGSYPMGDYSSSNFDGDMYSYDPALGEESSSRDPFADWRDCCGPPWPHPSLTTCPYALAPCYATYKLPSFTWSAATVAPTRVAAQVLPNVLPCEWKITALLIGGAFWTFILQINPDGSASFNITAVAPGPLAYAAIYDSPGPVDPGSAFLVFLRAGSTPTLTGPAYIRFTGSDPALLLIAPCVWIAVGPALYLRVGA